MQTLTKPTIMYHEEWEIDEDGERVATHPDAYLEPPCCKTPQGEYGRWDCGCQGQYSVVCPATDCPGIQDHEVDALFDRLMGGDDV